MKKSNTKLTIQANDKQAIEFPILELSAASSPTKGEVEGEPTVPTPVETKELLSEKYSPEFLELASPKLPTLSKKNRAKLLMQSPTKLHFYWSIGKNPYHTLNRAIGETGSYTLVLKLIKLRRDSEQIIPIETAGSYWFDVDADSQYVVELGFYATNRPFVKILRSNIVETPRKRPSRRPAESARWSISSRKFAEVLDNTGYSRDAFDVALVGDDVETAEVATHSAFAQFVDMPIADFSTFASEDLRYVMLALASGVSMDRIREQIDASLFDFISSSSVLLDESRALSALQEEFEFDANDLSEDEEIGDAVFGASIVNFPRRQRRYRRLLDTPHVSSAMLGRS